MQQAGVVQESAEPASDLSDRAVSVSPVGGKSAGMAGGRRGVGADLASMA